MYDNIFHEVKPHSKFKFLLLTFLDVRFAQSNSTNHQQFNSKYFIYQEFNYDLRRNLKEVYI